MVWNVFKTVIIFLMVSAIVGYLLIILGGCGQKKQIELKYKGRV